MSESSSPGRLPNFDPVARLYRWAEYLLLGTLLQKTREQLLPELPETGSALVLGDGDGRFTAALLRRRPLVQVVALDASQAMLALLASRCRFASERLRVGRADIRHLAPLLASLPSSHLFVSHFVLDCLEEQDLSTLAQVLHEHAAPGAVWLVSDFALPPKQPWKLLGAAYIRLLYLLFRTLTGLQVQHLPAIDTILAAAGWRRRTSHVRLGGLLFSALWEAHPLPADSPFTIAHATASRALPSTQT